MTVVSQITGSICDAVPVNQPGKSTVIDKTAYVLITAFIVRYITTGNQLIICLSKCQFISLCLIFFNYLIHKVYQFKTFAPEIYFLVLNLRH